MIKREAKCSVRKMTNPRFLVALIGLLQLVISCSSGSGARNDTPPSGTVVAAGSFTGSSNGITGTVTVYDQGGGNYTVRIANLSMTQPVASYQLQADISSGRVTVSGSLAAYSGNVNYSYGAGADTVWSTVYIHQPANDTDPGIAVLTQD